MSMISEAMHGHKSAATSGSTAAATSMANILKSILKKAKGGEKV